MKNQFALIVFGIPSLPLRVLYSNHIDFCAKPTTLLFPYTMLSSFLLESITPPFIALAFIQFPLSGFILGLANVKDPLRSVGLGLVLMHISALALCLWANH